MPNAGPLTPTRFATPAFAHARPSQMAAAPDLTVDPDLKDFRGQEEVWTGGFVEKLA